jgi:DNA polymerase V
MPFPSPAADFKDSGIDLNKLLRNPASSFPFIIEGDYLNSLGLYNGDLLFVDRSLTVENGMLVSCYLDGEFHIRRVLKEKSELWLLSGHDKYLPVHVTSENEFVVVGVVALIVRDCMACMRW